MLSSDSSSVPDIAKSLKGSKFSNILFDSVSKRIRRFFNNSLFDSYSFYHSIIRYIIDNFKVKHYDKNIHITFDHMFSHDNYIKSVHNAETQKKDKVIQEKDEVIYNYAKELYKQNKSFEEISNITKLSIDTIKNIINN